MSDSNRCLYDSSINEYLSRTDTEIFGMLCTSYHGVAKPTTLEAWQGEIPVMRDVLEHLDDKNGQIIFEYDIPRLWIGVQI